MTDHTHDETFPASSVRDWCLANDARYVPLLPARPGKTYAPYYLSGVGFGSATDYLLPEAYMAEIPNATVVGGQGIVMVDGVALFDPVFQANAERYLFANLTMPVVSTDAIEVVTFRPDPEEVIPKGILLQSWFANNYHHWLVEHLSKLLLVELSGIPSNVPILVDDRVMAVDQLPEALAVATSRQVIGLHVNTEYRVEHLYLPSNLFGTGPNLQLGMSVEVGDVTVARDGIEFLRRKFAGKQEGSRLLYIDRRAMQAPIRLRNTDEVAEVFRSFGFDVIRPGDLTFAEQQALFSGAAVIAGESGAALTNMLLAPETTVMICLQARPFPLNIYSDLCAYGGQRSRFLVGDVDVMDPSVPSYQATFTYDPGKLEADLTGILRA